MNAVEIDSFALTTSDDVRGFVGPVHLALVFSEHYEMKSLFLQMPKDAGFFLKVARALLGLAEQVAAGKFALMEGEEDITPKEAEELVDLVTLASCAGVNLPEWLWAIGGLVEDKRDVVKLARRGWERVGNGSANAEGFVKW
jgi:hypothetical protein